MNWLKSLMNPSDRETDVKLLAFASVVAFAIWKLALSPIDGAWVDSFYGLCALVGLGGTAWAAVDRWRTGETSKSSTGAKNEEGKP